MTEKKVFQRLPTSVLPKVFDILLKPDLKTFELHGEERVEIQILQPTNKIIFNTAELVINIAKLRIIESSRELIPQVFTNECEETTSLIFSETISIGDVELFLDFSGILNLKLKGFFIGLVTSSVEETLEYVAATQFAPVDARRCFPCWDEPAIKSFFDITVAIEQNIKCALSNMPVQNEYVNNEGKRVIKFERSPIMSAYLVAIVVGDFDYVEDKTTNGTAIRVYTPVGKEEQGKFALYVATKILPYYEDYFQIAYPLPKLDLIALPELSFGAMENWGLVTYREGRLLIDDENSTVVTKQIIANIVGHELAHMWFGNLVTMEWWTHLWLNEGYASFVQYLCVDYLFPEFDAWTQFAAQTCSPALKEDALENSHPVEVPIYDPTEINEIFDNISYDKGASILRMLHRYIGDKGFRKGMNLYLTKHKYGNASTEDLWASLEEAINKPVKSIMRTWTKQMGYPVIKVEQIEQTENTRILRLSQTKFSTNGTKSDDTSLWLVPLSFIKASDPENELYSDIMDKKYYDIVLKDVLPNEWVKLNAGGVGFYRVKYEPKLLHLLSSSVKDRTLPPLDRFGLLDDLFALVQSGQVSTIQLLEFIQQMTEEDNYTVWKCISYCLDNIHVMLYNTDFKNLFHTYGLSIIESIASKLGYDSKPGESHLDKLLRNLVLSLLVAFGDKKFLKEAEQRFINHRDGICTIPVDLRSSVYQAVISTGGEEAYDKLIEIYRQTDLQEEKERIFRSFISITDKKIAEKALQFARSDEVTQMNSVTCFVYIASSAFGRDLVWNFIKENWDNLHKTFQAGRLLRSLVSTIESYASKEILREIENYFDGKCITGVERTLNQSLEKIRINIAWLERDGSEIHKFLKNQFDNRS